MNATLPTAAEQEDQVSVTVTGDLTDIEQANSELVVAEELPIGDLTLEEIIMKEGRRQDGEVSVKLTDEQIKEKHDKFHEIYREQVLDTMEFGELRKQFNARKKLRETDMAKLDNCLVRGEETQCVTRWRIPAHKLSVVLPFETIGAEEEAFIFDADFNLIDRVPLTEMERQMQIEYEESSSTSAPNEVAEEPSDASPEADILEEEVPERPKYFIPAQSYA